MSRPVKSPRGWNSISVDSESIDVSTLDQKFNHLLLPTRIADKNVYRPVPKQLSKSLRLKRMSSQPLHEAYAGQEGGPSTASDDKLTGRADREVSVRPLDIALENVATKKKKGKDAKIKRRTEIRKKTTNVIKCPQSIARRNETSGATSMSPDPLTATMEPDSLQIASSHKVTESPEKDKRITPKCAVASGVVSHAKSSSAPCDSQTTTAGPLSTKMAKNEATGMATETLVETDLRPGVFQRVVWSFKSRKTTRNVKIDVTDSITEGETLVGAVHEKASDENAFRTTHKEDTSECLLEREKLQSHGGSNDIINLDCGASLMQIAEAWPQGPIDVESSANSCFTSATYGILDGVGHAFYKTMSRLAVYSEHSRLIRHNAHITSRSLNTDGSNCATNNEIPESRDDEGYLIESMNREANDCRDQICNERDDQSLLLRDVKLGGATNGDDCLSSERVTLKPDKLEKIETEGLHNKHPDTKEDDDSFHESYLVGYLLGILAVQRNLRSLNRRSTGQECSRLVFVHESDREIELEAVPIKDECNDVADLPSNQEVPADAKGDQTQIGLNNAPSSPRYTPDASQPSMESIKDKVSVHKSTPTRLRMSSDISLIFSAATPIEEIIQMVQTQHPTQHLAKGFLVYTLTKLSKRAKSIHHGGFHMGFTRCLSESVLFTGPVHGQKMHSEKSPLTPFVNGKSASSMLSEIVASALALASASYSPRCSRSTGPGLQDSEKNDMPDGDLESVLASVKSSLSRISLLPTRNSAPVIMSDLSLSSGSGDSWTSNTSDSMSYSHTCDSTDADEDYDVGGGSSASSSAGAGWMGILAKSSDSTFESDDSVVDRLPSFDVTEFMLRE